MANDKPINQKALLELKQYIPWLTGQQYKTLRGQILAGNDEAAMKGLQKILSISGKKGGSNGRTDLLA